LQILNMSNNQEEDRTEEFLHVHSRSVCKRE